MKRFMITRIKIDGFKSLVNTELYFGPFTCIVGANAIGKSNFFDALSFLSNLADKTIVEASKSVRSENQKHSNIRDIFFRNGSDYMNSITFEVDILIPKTGIDDLGQMAEATITSLKYKLVLELNNEMDDSEPVKILQESLDPITLSDTKRTLKFDFKKGWIDSILEGRRSTKNPFISTDGEKIKLHQDGNKGRTTDFIAQKMPRTLLSTVTAESPTAFLARQEMRNWMMLQFEPSALRQPNFIYEVKNAEIKANGLNLPATLYRLQLEKKDKDVYQILTNKLGDLVENVDEISIDKDEKRDLLTLQVVFKDGLTLPAQSLSDGTLRFLGLAVIEQDNAGSRVICLEEPENGINPKKIYEMVELLQGMATDTDSIVDEDNPLRQVIINTHSPIVASSVPDESLYLAKSKERYVDQFTRKIQYTGFSAMQGTWKTQYKLADITSSGEILAYLDKKLIEQPNVENMVSETQESYSSIPTKKTKKRTVAENALQYKLNFVE
jgi:predicted ATPase